MAETSLKPLKAILETIREQADFALRQLHVSQQRAVVGRLEGPQHV
jgi:hypothetical protein